MAGNQTSFRPSEEKRRILLVDDEVINQEILQMMLRDTYEVVPALTGKEALDILHEQYEILNLVLLDLNLPDIHGLEVLWEMKNDSRYIPKPYPRQEVVLARVRRTIELSEDRDILHWTERDRLTGLYNKDFFCRYAVQLDARHKDYPTDAILLNVNHFHTINERYGKKYGDELLREIGQKALEFVEEAGGIACRSEADNFLLYCPSREDYAPLLEKVSVRMPGSGNGEEESRVWIRMGVYAGVDKELDVERRFDRAKSAADTVKGNFTKNIAVYDDSLHEREMLEQQLIEDFPAALREKQFDVYFQPKFDVRPEKPVMCSAEALVRWKHPRLGMISPGIFIPLFENNGLIFPLDCYVWTEAAGRIRDWKERLGITLPVSVNVSRVDMYEPGLVDLLREICEQNGLHDGELLLEVTESAYTGNSEQIVEKVRQLREIGFRIEMDDFGSGYSSLNMLSTLPIDALKLDMQFIRNAFKEKKDTRLLEMMIHLAETFRVPVIAEGVETAEQVAALKEMGCDIIQGYYFSRPLPGADFETFMLENRPAGGDCFRPKEG